MTHRIPPSASSSCVDQKEESFGDSLKSLHSCCAQACNAAFVERYSMAHELFQEALVFFGRAHGVSCSDGDELSLWPHNWQLNRARRQLDECAALIYTEAAVKQNMPISDLALEAVKQRVRLDELPTLIAAADEHGGLDASQSLRTERGDLEMYVPALESECPVLSHEALCAQIAQCEQELLEAETTLEIATRFRDGAHQEFKQKGCLPEAQTLVITTALHKAQAQMYEAHHTVEELRLKIANLRISLSL